MYHPYLGTVLCFDLKFFFCKGDRYMSQGFYFQILTRLLIRMNELIEKLWEQSIPKAQDCERVRRRLLMSGHCPMVLEGTNEQGHTLRWQHYCCCLVLYSVGALDLRARVNRKRMKAFFFHVLYTGCHQSCTTQLKNLTSLPIYSSKSLGTMCGNGI